jgi:multisubunit Na+/H+ antiporter MnhC subunit
MLAKLNGASALPAEAQGFLVSYKQLLEKMTDADASEATIQLMYKSYYAEMGGAGTAPEIPARSSDAAPDSGNVTAFRRPPAKPKVTASGPQTTRPLPVALIFTCLVVVYVGIRYYWR